MAGRTGGILFVTGRQGAGKNALADALAASHPPALHFDGDVWALGFDPTLGPAPPPEAKVEDDAMFKERLAAISTFLAKFREAPSDVVDEPSAWQPFYRALCDDVRRLSAREGRTVIVTHSVYRRSMRAFVREQLGATLLFLDPPPELALARAGARCAVQYAAAGKSAEEWAALLRPNSAGFEDVTSEEAAALQAVVVSNDESVCGSDALCAAAEAALAGAGIML